MCVNKVSLMETGARAHTHYMAFRYGHDVHSSLIDVSSFVTLQVTYHRVDIGNHGTNNSHVHKEKPKNARAALLFINLLFL